MKKGIFISFEGGEGAGKTTLITHLFERFTSLSYNVVKVREPGGTQLGEAVRKILLDPKLHISSYAELALFLSSRAQHVEEVISPHLEKGHMVLCDRFHDSTVAYQGYARGIGVEKVKEFCDFFSKKIHPHLTFYLDLSYPIGKKRNEMSDKNDRLEKETKAFHEKVRKGFLKIAQKEPNRFIVIDASKTKDQVFQDVFEKINLFLSNG